MSLLVVGSVAYDTIKTPHGEVRDALGGSAVYFSLAARHFLPVRLVGVVGDDFARRDHAYLADRDVDLAGLEVISGGRTFRWEGEYSPDMNDRETLSVELNVFEDFAPKIPAEFRDSRYVFLANGSPVTQLSVLDQIERPAFVMADTMDLWIQTQQRDLRQLLERVDGLLLNDSEAHLLTDKPNILEAGRAILAMGPRRVVVKKGEHGAILFADDQIVPLPAYPVLGVRDPTGAGDSFAGALMGHLARSDDVAEDSFKRSLAHGTVVASVTVEDFGIHRLGTVEPNEIGERYEQFRRFLRIEETNPAA